jgi:hypothetical protein
VNVSSFVPPVTVRLATVETARFVAVPSIVTTMSSPESVTEMSCAVSLEALIVHAAGGEGPLPGVAAGSTHASSALEGLVVGAAGGVADVPAAVVPFVSVFELPPLAPPTTPVWAFWSFCVCAESPPADDVGPVAVLTCVVSVLPVETPAASTVPVPPLPTCAVTTGGAGGAVFSAGAVEPAFVPVSRAENYS